MTTYHANGIEEHQAKSLTEEMRDNVSSRVGDARDVADRAGREVAESARRTADGSAQFVRDNPGIAMAGAVGFGVLIGLALRGRS